MSAPSGPPDHLRPDHAGVAFHPPLLLAACLAGGFAARVVAPLPFLPARWPNLAGPVVTALSLGLFVWAVRAMRRAGASIPTGEPSEIIVVAPPYSFTRNPIYLSMLLLQGGVALWANSLWFLAGAVLCGTLLSWGVISREERYLRRKFGEPYTAYRARVRRWI